MAGHGIRAATGDRGATRTITHGTTVYPLEAGTAVPLVPLEAFPEPLVIGDPSLRVDQRVLSLVHATNRGGMGEARYTESQGVDTYRWGTADTRHEGAIVPSPEAVQLIGTALSANATAPWYVEGTPHTPDTRFLMWSPAITGDAAYRYDISTTSFVVPEAGLSSVTGFCRYKQHFIYARTVSNSTRLAYSTDGESWTTCPRGVEQVLCATHDNKLYYYNRTNAVIEFTTDVTSSVAPGTAGSPYGQTESLVLQPGERLSQLFEWADPRYSNKKALFILTSQRLLFVDDDALTIQHYDDLTETIPDGYPRAHVWKRTDDLYLTFYSPTDPANADLVWQYTGATRAELGPNKRGGLPAAQLTTMTTLTGGLHWLYAWGKGRAGGVGAAYAMDDGNGFHALVTRANVGGVKVMGGGYSRGALWTVFSDGIVWEQQVPDTAQHPLQASDRRYASGEVLHVFADTDFGSPNTPKLALRVRLKCRKTDGTPGIPDGSVEIRYAVDGGAFVSAGTATSATTTWPATFELGTADAAAGVTAYGGVPFKDALVVMLVMMRGAVATSAPIVTEVIVEGQRQPEPTYGYQARIDLRDSRWGGGPLKEFGGKTAAQLRAALRAAARPGRLKQLVFGSGKARTTVKATQVRFGGSVDPDGEDGLYSVTFEDVSTAGSGTTYGA